MLKFLPQKCPLGLFILVGLLVLMVLLQAQMVRQTPAASFVRADLHCVIGPDTRMESHYCTAVQ